MYYVENIINLSLTLSHYKYVVPILFLYAKKSFGFAFYDIFKIIDTTVKGFVSLFEGTNLELL